MFWFAFASLLPCLLLALACAFGGVWPALALVSVTGLVFFMDRIVPDLAVGAQGEGGATLSWVLGAAHFGLWGAGVWATGANPLLTTLDKVLLVAGLGLYFGQISNSNAHELIHRPARGARRLGIAIYGSLLFAHHASAHMRVHHLWAATPHDPSTARLGEGFWRYLPRAWAGGFMAGKRVEDRLRRGRASPPWRHPYVGYVLLSAGAVLLAALIGGRTGATALLVIAAHAQVQLFLCDYVQHYGLERGMDPEGRPEPIGPAHSWNAPQWYSSAMMLNAPHHSDHHLHPARAFQALGVRQGEMPILPYSLPVMAVIALFPMLWRRVMDKRVTVWRGKAAEMNGAAA